jgi:hypothetical protein
LRVLFTFGPTPYIAGMLKSSAYRPSKFAHDAALHVLARPKEYPLGDAERRNLMAVVEAHIGAGDERAARLGVEWMRDIYRRKGKPLPF